MALKEMCHQPEQSVVDDFLTLDEVASTNSGGSSWVARHPRRSAPVDPCCAAAVRKIDSRAHASAPGRDPHWKAAVGRPRRYNLFRTIKE
jgi:hypothetical protein